MIKKNRKIDESDSPLGISLIIPIYNEQKILEPELTAFIKRLDKRLNLPYEIILSENGSTDSTLKIAKRLAKDFSFIKVLHSAKPHFGYAFRAGAEHSSFRYVYLLNADWLEDRFVQKALSPLKKNSVVIGSKVLAGAEDKRPIIRKAASYLLTHVLRWFFAYHGSDSHGLKAFDRKVLLKLLKQCECDEIIESELLLRANRAGYKISEIAVSVKEIRAPRISVFRRCFMILNELVKLYRVMQQADKSSILYHADDLGLNQRVNEKIFALIKQNKLQSVSLLPNMPGFLRAAGMIRKMRTAPPVFLHFNLIEGQPVSRAESIPTLVNSNGGFLGRKMLIRKIALGRIKKTDVERELLAQYKKVIKAKVLINGLDSHQHFHAFTPIAEAALKITTQEKISHIRSYGAMKTTTIIGRFKYQLLKLSARWSRLVYCSSLKLPPTWQGSKKSPLYIASWEKVKLSKIRKGGTVVFHPGTSYDKLPITPKT